MPHLSAHQPRRALDPLERSSEILFGLIMLLTFTGSISVADGGQTDIRGELAAALGCNFAWGIVDSVMYLIGRFTDRARTAMALDAIRRTESPDVAQQIVRDALPPAAASVMTTPEIDTLRARLAALPQAPAGIRFTRDDLAGATAVFLLVFLSTLPPVVPFVLMRDAGVALRASHGVVLVMLFAAGWSLGSHAGRPGWRAGLAMPVLGFVLAAFTMVLGG